jgi:hypothetical protein
VGKNSKRHDLERQKTPGLHDSDLQQGDVQALEQGQRIAPVQTQAPAVAPRGAATRGTQAQAAPQIDPNNPMSIVEARLGGTIPQDANSTGILNAKGKRNADRWLGFFTMLSNHPTASQVTRSAARAQREAVLATRPARQSAQIDLNVVDDLIEQTLLSEGF